MICGNWISYFFVCSSCLFITNQFKRQWTNLSLEFDLRNYSGDQNGNYFYVFVNPSEKLKFSFSLIYLFTSFLKNLKPCTSLPPRKDSDSVVLEESGKYVEHSELYGGHTDPYINEAAILTKENSHGKKESQLAGEDTSDPTLSNSSDQTEQNCHCAHSHHPCDCFGSGH